MKWSKLKKSIEGLLADSLQGRIQFYVTRYGPGHSDIMSRAWITWDNKELVNFSTAEWMLEYYRLANQIREVNRCQDFQDSEQREGYYDAYEQAESVLDKKGIYSRFDFYESLEEYLQLSIEEAMISDNTIIRAVSMFDRRLGKRRLHQMQLASTEHPLIRRFYELRCEVEGIKR